MTTTVTVSVPAGADYKARVTTSYQDSEVHAGNSRMTSSSITLNVLPGETAEFAVYTSRRNGRNVYQSLVIDEEALDDADRPGTSSCL